MDDQELRSIVESATGAPSVHNTQPWRFVGRLAPDGTAWALDVMADPSRQLKVIDPEQRELHVSCGAAIELAVVALRGRGVGCTVDLLPTPGASDHLARVTIGPPEPPSPDDRLLLASLPAAYTERGPFDDRAVPESLRAHLRQEAARAGAWLLCLDRPGQWVTAAVLLARADAVEQADPAYRQELARWVGLGGEPPGTPAGGTGRRRATTLRRRELEPPGEPASTGAGSEPPFAGHPLLVVIGTAEDDPLAWLQAGRALARMMLRAAADGVSASPMTEVLELPSTRAMLARGLGLVGYPQMVLEMGYARCRPAAARRPVDEVYLTSTCSAASPAATGVPQGGRRPRTAGAGRSASSTRPRG
ncbi:MAG TPA: nitroreductase family protein [Acidimicrobiales bacterium]|nr:nitroreductase family protein [Acidimicrobiales bacterium]